MVKVVLGQIKRRSDALVLLVATFEHGQSDIRPNKRKLKCVIVLVDTCVHGQFSLYVWM